MLNVNRYFIIRSFIHLSANYLFTQIFILIYQTKLKYSSKDKTFPIQIENLIIFLSFNLFILKWNLKFILIYTNTIGKKRTRKQYLNQVAEIFANCNNTRFNVFIQNGIDILASNHGRFNHFI